MRTPETEPEGDGAQDALHREIDRLRAVHGDRLLVLGHHYQRASVLMHADQIGDSLELSRYAEANRRAQRIVFCGVRFMAESADLLTEDFQEVYMPDTSAGCPMAAMADAAQLEAAWRVLALHGGGFLPVVYVNSSAELKAACGRLGGLTCTSGNAEKVIQWVTAQGRRVFFLPDEHLGINTAFDLGWQGRDVAVYDPALPEGGLSAAQFREARLIAWKGYCIVHTAFTVEQVKRVRACLPGARIIVHPETPHAVVRLCDAHGSTSRIIKEVAAAPAGSTVVIGTETHLIQRLAEQEKGRVTVKALHPSVCANMARTHLHNLADVLRDFPASRRIRVDPEMAADARLALTRMLDL